MEARPVSEIRHFIRENISRQYGLIAGLGDIRLEWKKRLQLEFVDTGLNLLGRFHVACLDMFWVYNRLAHRPQEFSRLPLDRARVRLGQFRESLKIKTRDSQALNHSPDAICYVRPTGVIRWANTTMPEMFGYDPQEMIGKSIFNFVNPEDRPGAEETYARFMQREMPSPPEARFLKKDGTVFWGWVYGRFLKEKEETVSVVLTIRDITERKEKELQKIINERLNVIRDIWLGLNHVFNNAMVPIIYYLENIERVFSRGDPELLASYMGKAKGSAVSLHAFSKKLQFFINFSTKEKVWSDLGLLVVNIFDLMGEKLRLQGISATINEKTIEELTKEKDVREIAPVMMPLDVVGMQMAIMDLINNAIDAITTRAAKEDDAPRNISVKITEEKKAEDKYAVIAIADSGCGIGPEEIKRIFVPFFTTKPEGQGTGLGMTIVQQIIKEHGGTISVSSEPGELTKFTVRLPMSGWRLTGKIG